MFTTIPQFYKCDRCSGNAFKHLDFGLLIKDALTDGGRISAISYTPLHLNLCRRHLNEANTTFVHYREYALDTACESDRVSAWS
jgi:hypothetical protein